MDKTARMCLCLTVVLFGGCAFLLGEREHLTLFFDESNWRVGHSGVEPGAGQIQEFVRKGETIENWTELLTLMNFARTPSASPSPEAVMNEAKAKLEQRCPGVTWKVLERQETAILYEWQTADCPSSPNHRSVARVLDGKWNRWVLAYEIKVKDWPEAKRSLWIELLSKARVEKDALK